MRTPLPAPPRTLDEPTSLFSDIASEALERLHLFQVSAGLVTMVVSIALVLVSLVSFFVDFSGYQALALVLAPMSVLGGFLSHCSGRLRSWQTSPRAAQLLFLGRWQSFPVQHLLTRGFYPLAARCLQRKLSPEAQEIAWSLWPDFEGDLKELGAMARLLGSSAAGT